MPLQKTITYPDQNPDSIIQKPILKLVVLGNHEKIVNLADNLALCPPTAVDRYVIWFKSLLNYDLHKKFPDLPSDISNISAFSLSTKNKVADLIYANEIVEYTRIDLAFTRAGLPKYN